MRRRPKRLLLLAAFFIVYIPVFLMLSLCYCLLEADFFDSPAFEAPDLMSEPASSPGHDKSLALSVHYDLVSVLNSNPLDRFPPVSLRIPSFDLTTDILRC